MSNTKYSPFTVAILGAGIMGSSLALYLARKNIKVVLIDAAPHPFMGASRWNEGKIHLGYLYGADPTLETARKLIPGGVNFPLFVKDLVGRDLDNSIFTQQNDRYLIHKNSVVNSESAFALAKKVSVLTQEHPDTNNYFVSLSNFKPRLLTASELESEYNTEEIVSAFEVPERSVNTQRIADYYVDALCGCPQIEFLMGQRVLAVKELEEKKNTWVIKAVSAKDELEVFGPFDAVVNALWEGRGAVDASIGLQEPSTWTHRYRVSLFAKTKVAVDLKSAVIAVGPFGDVKNYDRHHLYLSWYNTGLLVKSSNLLPPPIPKLNKEEKLLITKDKLKNIGEFIPLVRGLFENFESYEVKGGWVYAAGQGALSDPKSDLHKRNRIGLYSKQNYFSVDTGKYSIAPWLAKKVANAVIDTIF